MKSTKLTLITIFLTFTMMMSSCAPLREKIRPTNLSDTETDTVPRSESNVTGSENSNQQPEMDESDDRTPVVITENYLPADVYSRMKVLFETGAGNFKAYPTAQAPFVIRDLYTIVTVESIPFPSPCIKHWERTQMEI